MYEMHTFRAARACFRNALKFLYDAIWPVEELELAEDVNYLRQRIEHIQWIFRSQLGE